MLAPAAACRRSAVAELEAGLRFSATGGKPLAGVGRSADPPAARRRSRTASPGVRHGLCQLECAFTGTGTAYRGRGATIPRCLAIQRRPMPSRRGPGPIWRCYGRLNPMRIMALRVLAERGFRGPGAGLEPVAGAQERLQLSGHESCVVASVWTVDPARSGGGLRHSATDVDLGAGARFAGRRGPPLGVSGAADRSSASLGPTDQALRRQRLDRQAFGPLSVAAGRFVKSGRRCTRRWIARRLALDLERNWRGFRWTTRRKC
jgi:hypothetical protein